MLIKHDAATNHQMLLWHIPNSGNTELAKLPRQHKTHRYVIHNKEKNIVQTWYMICMHRPQNPALLSFTICS